VTAGTAVPIAWSSTPQARPGGTRITLRWAVSFTTHDLAPTGPSSCDTLQAHFTLAGRMKGSADFACTAVDANYLCQGIRLPGGDLYAQTGPVDETRPTAIVVGTRAYDGARGQFTQLERPIERGTWTITLRG
jgi:hypothetical protein